MSEGEEKKVVCVTGASGYIASWLVKLLLDRGYVVNGTVRNLGDRTKTEHLLTLEGAQERLHLFEADLIVEGSFDSAVAGCIGIFHTASPVLLTPLNPQVEVIDPAVKGTLNVLKSCAKVSTLKRVIITSSMASVMMNGRPLTSDVIIDETWFSDPSFCEKNKLWYPLSKTLAEEVAWNFSKENGIDLVTLHPGFVIGPLLQPTLNLTSQGVLNFIKNGTNGFGLGMKTVQFQFNLMKTETAKPVQKLNLNRNQFNLVYEKQTLITRNRTKAYQLNKLPVRLV